MTTVGLIGCGFFARNHMHAWRDLGVTVAGVCDRDPAKAADFAATFGGPAFTDATAMLNSVRPDIIDIATTVDSHRALVTLAAGRAPVVICQKPFADTIDDAQTMVDSCAAAGSTLFVHENFRWQMPWRQARTLVGHGAIGTPRWLRLSFRHGYDIYQNQPYLAQVQDLALTDIGLHVFDMARWLMGDVVRVSCETQRRNSAVVGQDAFQATLRHASGAVSTVDVSFLSGLTPDPFPQTLGQVEGDGGTVTITEGYGVHLSTDDRRIVADPPVPTWGARPWHLIQDSVLAFQGHVLDVLAGRATPQPSGADNLQTLRVMQAAIRSAANGQTVTL
jgi:D-apiose dehydrogenase